MLYMKEKSSSHDINRMIGLIAFQFRECVHKMHFFFTQKSPTGRNLFFVLSGVNALELSLIDTVDKNRPIGTSLFFNGEYTSNRKVIPNDHARSLTNENYRVNWDDVFSPITNAKTKQVNSRWAMMISDLTQIDLYECGFQIFTDGQIELAAVKNNRIPQNAADLNKLFSEKFVIEAFRENLVETWSSKHDEFDMFLKSIGQSETSNEVLPQIGQARRPINLD